MITLMLTVQRIYQNKQGVNVPVLVMYFHEEMKAKLPDVVVVGAASHSSVMNFENNIVDIAWNDFLNEFN